MAVERAAGGTSLIDVLDRVLDKGIVIDAWVRVSLVGIDLITVEARVVVASIDTYLKYSEAVGAAASAARPTIESPRPYDEIAAENVSLRAQLEGPAGGTRTATGTRTPTGARTRTGTRTPTGARRRTRH
jgi:hypothetical protein